MATDVEAATAGTPVKSVPRKAQFQSVVKEVITATVTFDEDTIAAAKASQADVAIPGADLGDLVFVTAAIDTVYVLLTGKVKSAGVVTISALNQDSTDASTTLSAAPTVYVWVFKRNSNTFAQN